MKINTLIDDYSPLLLEEEIRKIIEYKSVLFEIHCGYKISHESLLTFYTKELFSFINRSSIENGTYLNFLDQEQIPVLIDLFNVKYEVSIDKEGKNLVKSIDHISHQYTFVETPDMSDVIYPDQEVFYVRVSLTLKSGVDVGEYFSSLSIGNMFRETLKRAINNSFFKGMTPRDRYSMINLSYENGNYRHSDMNIKRFESYFSYCMLLFKSISDDTFWYIINLKAGNLYGQNRPLLHGPLIKIKYNNDKAHDPSVPRFELIQ